MHTLVHHVCTVCIYYTRVICIVDGEVLIIYNTEL
jgi:hypothetical protein